MRRLSLFVVVLAFFAVQEVASAGPNLQQQIATALRTAHHADSIARAALAASKRLPATIKGSAGTTGSRGADGQNGSPGLPGQNGTTGAAGVNGSNGDQGPKGDDGIPGTSGVRAYGRVTADGTNTTTNGTTVTHPGVGLYCMADQGFTAVVVTPDWDATTMVLPPGDTFGSCAQKWTVLIDSPTGRDTGFYFIAN